ncbi:MAG: prenyltransferase/squalene oxidase repeat-containing protein [Acidimicrobiales bacterium]
MPDPSTSAGPGPFAVPSVEGILTADQVQATVDAIASWQLPNGMVPWFPGGHADPWNHVEAAMALALGGRRADAERAYEWLASVQRPDGAWHQYYLADGIEQDKLDANTIAYVAAGVWHHHLLFGDDGFAERMWPVVDRAIEFVLDLQTPRGEVIWARHADGTPWSFALLTGSSSMCHSLRCAIALAEHLGHERPDWELAAARLVHVVAAHCRGELPDAFAPKHRWAMDWYYPVLAGVLLGDDGLARLDERVDTFVVEGMGVRCVSDRPWITAAETCECLLAYLSAGREERALQLFEWAQGLRADDGHYWTGIVFPEMVHFPGNEKSTYTGASIVLAADALGRTTPASGLFVDHHALPELALTDAEDSIGDPSLD